MTPLTMKKKGTIPLEPMPYTESSLMPYMSSTTLNVHYMNHYKAYVNRTNRLVEETVFEGMTLKEIVLKTANLPDKRMLFNPAAQAWNHAFFWKSMRPKGGGIPGTELSGLIQSSFGELEDLKTQFVKAAMGHFGSGWVWLVKSAGRLRIVSTHDADNPLVHDERPLVTLDIWEHAYYLDYQSHKELYVKAFLNYLINWGFAENNL